MAYLMQLSERHALQDIKWLQMITRLPILVKGVITAEDGKYLVSVTSLNVMSLKLSYHPKHLQMCSSNCH
jgi:isopentenyl diphosphate isomerase/L-lactate dehydrogenase-like FMN-dependent dehydrogenase